jgi:Integrase core domain
LNFASLRLGRTDNSYVESFNGKFRDERLKHWFLSVVEARQIINAWRVDYNTVRPHRSFGQQTTVATPQPQCLTSQCIRKQPTPHTGFYGIDQMLTLFVNNRSVPEATGAELVFNTCQVSAEADRTVT